MSRSPAAPGPGVEIRTFTADLRVSNRGGAPDLKGHIALYDQLSDDMGGIRETIARGAFRETIAKDDIRALWNHQNDLVLGRNKSGTLKLSEDHAGLAFEVTPPDTTWFRDRMISIERRDVTGCSFGFYTDVDEWGTLPDGTKLRTLKKITLVEVSPGVTFPAYPQTDVALASLRAWRGHRSVGSERGVDLASMRRRLRLMELQMGAPGAVQAAADLAQRRRRLRLMELQLN